MAKIEINIDNAELEAKRRQNGDIVITVKQSKYSKAEKTRREELEAIVEKLESIPVHGTSYSVVQYLLNKYYSDAQVLLEVIEKCSSYIRDMQIQSALQYLIKVSRDPATIGEAQSEAYKKEPVHIGAALRKLSEE